MSKGSFVKKTKISLRNNSPLIFTVLATGGVVTTTVLTAQASFKASDLLREKLEEKKDQEENGDRNTEEFDWKEKVEIVWPLYIPAASVGVATIASIILLNRAGSRKTATATALYTMTDKAMREYQAKVVEKIGEEKETAIRDEVAQDNVTANPPVDREVIITGNGTVLFYDSITGRYFNSDVETVRKAQNDINHRVLNEMYASLSEFYELIGLATTPYSEDVGWNTDELMELEFSTTLTEDNRPCISMDYNTNPIKGYDRLV